MYIDSHSHWSDPRFKKIQIGSLLQKAQDAQITQFMLGGVDPSDWERQIEIKKLYPLSFYLCFGLHPYFISQNVQQDCEMALDSLAKYLGASADHRPLALGETGLDFRDKILELGAFSKEEVMARQIDFFENQLELAQVYSYPVVLHIVQAHEKALQIFDMWGVPSRRGLIHAFNGSYEIAKKYIDLGFFISVGGAVTFEKNRKLHQALEKLPLESLLLESDAPDQAPQGWEGLNDSSSLWQIAKSVAMIRKMTPEKVLEISTQNFKKLFTL